MSNIRDKVAKLLALADSPNEQEARAALLKARELMAQYKLSPEDVKKAEKVKVIVETIGITCTKMTDTWAVSLAATIAAHYCCKAYRSHRKGAKSVEIGFAGLEDDFAICKQIYLYAYDCVKAMIKEIQTEHRKRGYSAGDIREMCNAYGFGFNSGLLSAYERQQAEHQEWGLVLVVPQEVEAATAHHRPPSAYAEPKVAGWRGSYAAKGYQDGERFDVSRRIAPTRDGERLSIAGKRAPLQRYTAAVEISRENYRMAQALLALENFSEMSRERRQALGVREDSAVELARTKCPDGTWIMLALCSDKERYYIVPAAKAPGSASFTKLTEHRTYQLQRQMRLEFQGCEYRLQARLEGEPAA